MSEDFEDQLREVLRRRDPSAGFAERVMRAIPPKRSFLARQAWAVAVIAAMLVMAVFVYQGYQQRRSEDAGRQALLALRITAEKLNVVRDKVLSQQTRMEADKEN